MKSATLPAVLFLPLCLTLFAVPSGPVPGIALAAEEAPAAEPAPVKDPAPAKEPAPAAKDPLPAVDLNELTPKPIPAADPPGGDAAPGPEGEPRKGPKEEPIVDIPGMRRLAPDAALWIDRERKILVIDGKVAVREGQLEMFACPKGTKEHESIISVRTKAQYVHAGLLVLGAKAGEPVRFDPEYVPPMGTRIDILVLWRDAEGKNRVVRAQEWIRHVKTKKQMEYPWVFAGSGFWVDDMTGERYYHADAGDLICVSNFPTAMLDVPVPSTDADASLVFEPFTERIPPKGTRVRLVLIPRTELDIRTPKTPDGTKAPEPPKNPEPPKDPEPPKNLDSPKDPEPAKSAEPPAK